MDADGFSKPYAL